MGTQSGGIYIHAATIGIVIITILKSLTYKNNYKGERAFALLPYVNVVILGAGVKSIGTINYYSHYYNNYNHKVSKHFTNVPTCKGLKSLLPV